MKRVLLIVLLGLVLSPLSTGRAQESDPNFDWWWDTSCMLAQAEGDTTFPTDTEAERMHRRGRKMMEQGLQRRRQLEQFKLLKLLELLDLQEDQEVDFIQAYRQMRREEKELMERHRTILNEVGEGVHSQNFSDDDYNRRIDDMLRLENDRRELEDRFVTRCREFLTPEQVAKFLVFRWRFEQEMLRSLGRFGRGDGGPGGPGPGLDGP
jgi:hypothetical protein